MSYVKRKGSKDTFRVVDSQCLARPCFRPGYYESRGATLSGSRNTGNVSACCTRNAYHGCPNPGSPEHQPSPELEKQRKGEGWRKA